PLSGERRTALACGRALRRAGRARLQRLPARARKGERHLHARGEVRLRTNRRLHSPYPRAPRAPARAAWVLCHRAGPHGKKPPDAKASGVTSTAVEMACSGQRRARWSPSRAGRQALVVVSAFAMIDEIEAFALLIGPRSQSHERFHDREKDC